MQDVAPPANRTAIIKTIPSGNGKDWFTFNQTVADLFTINRMPTAYAPEGVRRSGGSGDLRQGNLTHILSYVRDNGPCSRHDIAHGCGLGVSTLTDLIGELRSRRLVREMDPIRRPGAGRPTRPISLDGEPWCVLGVHIDVDAIQLAATTLGGRELWSEIVPVELRDSGNEVGLSRLTEVLQAALADVPSSAELISVEIGVPGYVARDAGVVTSSRLLGWDDLPLRDGIRDALVTAGLSPDLHVGISNDCHLSALYATREELTLPPLAVVVYLGGKREVGSGVIIDGRMFGGANGSAGDLGHHQVAAAGDRQCWCGRTGCLATVLNLTALLTDSGLLSPAEADQLVADDPQAAVERVLTAIEAGDEAAQQAIASAGEALGQVVDDVMGTLNPHAVVLAGFLGRFENALMPHVQQRVAQRLSTLPFGGTDVVVREWLPTRALGGATLEARDACLADPLRLTRIVAA